MFSTFYQSNEAAAVAQRNAVTACYACRFKKVKCPNERPVCRRCDELNMICQYPTQKSASRRSKSSSSQGDVGNEPIESNLGWLSDQGGESRDSSSSWGSLDQAGEQSGEESNPIYHPSPTQTNVTHGRDLMYPYEASCTSGETEGIHPFRPSTYETFASSLADDLSTPRITMLSSTASALLGTLHEIIPSAGANVKQTISNMTLDNVMGSGESRKACACNSAILGRLEHMLDWIKHKSLLETLLALRDNVHNLVSLSQCSRCLQSSGSMLLLVMFAEKLIDQLQRLLNSNMRLSINDNVSSICFAEYVTRSSQECSTMYYALLQLHTRNLLLILADLLAKALEWGWTGQATTLTVLTARVEEVHRRIRRQLFLCEGPTQQADVRQVNL